MSFFGRRRSRLPSGASSSGTPAPSEINLETSLKPGQASTDAVESLFKPDPSSKTIRKRVTAITNIFTIRQKRESGASNLPNIRAWGSLSRSPSPPSPDIRRPSGLGRRASIMTVNSTMSTPTTPSLPVPPSVDGLGRAARHLSSPTIVVSEPVVAPRQPSPPLPPLPRLPAKPSRKASTPTPSTSTPSTSTPSTPTPPATNPSTPTTSTPTPSTPSTPSRRATIPFRSVFAFLPKHDLTSLARVSKQFRTDSRHALYHALDLSDCDDHPIDQCITLLASKKEIADLVQSFVCPSFPTHSPSFTLALTMAFNNMRNLTSVSLPRFLPDVLQGASFRLKSVTLRQDSMPDPAAFISWLSSQPDITSLSFPYLTSAADLSTLFASSQCASNLTRFAGPPPLAARVAPGRPLTSITLHVDSTLYDGLRPAALMSALAQSTVSLTSLSIISSTPQAVDARTLAKLFLAAGSGLPLLQELHIGWVLEDQTLYKQIPSILPRLHFLRTLRLSRRTPRPFLLLDSRPTTAASSQEIDSYTLLFPSPPSMPVSPTLMSPVSPGFDSFDLLPPPSPLPTTADGLSANGNGSNGNGSGSLLMPVQIRTPVPQAARELHEKGHLKRWCGACPSLRDVSFLSGAKWRIVPPGEGEGAAPTFVCMKS
ncbi:uncharacterized protein STEHIDRAFT_125711 [Stereum hirsutum FP-91666 SS1]|uniref:uncharacterized protein n=1 Tax=Stereum hirsutum (strain FP-91666) TaxID=721885 RepID=UPI0004449F7A|nr:uncharacterized protein STEHIDRAFT_125711 [Stereum hirsutum FP-91666 SS1]EIM80689.1 hypothetical protein STEHIDRAFT_125711 [Stereum hirsutum FP-91666 SS1]